MNPRTPGGQGLIARTPRASDPTQQSWPIGPPSAAAPFDPAAGFPWAREGGEVPSVPTLDPSEQAWAVGPPLNVVVQTAWIGDPEVVTLATNDDPTVPAWAVGPPQNAVVAQTFPQPSDDERQAVPAPDDSIQSWAIQPPAAAGFDPATGFPWARQGDEVGAAPGVDDTAQAWAVQPPLNAVIAQAFNTPDDAAFTPIVDDTVPALPITPPPYVPVFQVTAWPVETLDERQAVPVDDPSIQSWAVGPALNAVQALAFNVPDDASFVPTPDETSQAYAIQPQAAAAFDPANGFPWPRPDDIAQPTWWTPDDTAQPWPIAPPVPLVFNVPGELPFAYWARVDENVAWSSWAAVSGAIPTVTGGHGPDATAAIGSTPPGTATASRPAGNAAASVPSSKAVGPTPRNE